VIVNEVWKIIWIWTNSSEYHKKFWCRRKDKNWNSLYKSGEKYELCPGCNPKTSHSESLAIKNIIIWNFLDKLKNNKQILEKYSDIISKMNLWIFETNLIEDINNIDSFENFLENIKTIIWEEEFEKKYKEIKTKINGSILFLYWHFWACPDCWNYVKNFWIKNIIVQKEAFNNRK
jgi:hypothetical protein